MIIQCPECSKRYKVDDNQIQSVGGRLVRCVSCDYEWLFKHNDIQASSSQTDEQSNVQSIIEKFEKMAINSAIGNLKISTPLKGDALSYSSSRNYKILSIFSIILILLSILIISRNFISDRVPIAHQMFEFMRLNNNHTIKLKELSVTYTSNNKIQLNLTINNTINQPQTLHSIRFTIYDINMVKLEENIIYYNEEVAANGNKMIKGTLSTIPDHYKYIAIELGNKLEFFTRDMSEIYVHL